MEAIVGIVERSMYRQFLAVWKGEVLFGDSVQSLATYYRYTHAISYERLSRLFGEVYNFSISEGGLSNLFQKVKGRMDGRVEEIMTRLQSSRLVCSDETGVRVKGRNEWEWVFQNEDVCVHVIRPSRGQQVIHEVMNGHRPHAWVSDLYGAQRNNPAYQWQVCLSHQLRDCEYAIEAGDSLFATQMKRVLLRAFVIYKRRDHLKEKARFISIVGSEAPTDSMFGLNPYLQRWDKTSKEV